MSLRSFWRVSSALLVFAAVMGFAALTPVAARQQYGQGGNQYGQGGNQGGGGSVVGTWALITPDGNGGQNYSWYTFTPNGEYQMVSAIQGGRNNGSVIQRWGTYQTRPAGNAIQVGVLVTGGADLSGSAAGQGCTPVQGIQRNMVLTFQVSPNALRQSDGTVFQRGQVPQQLQARLGGTRNQAPLQPPPGYNGGGGSNNGGGKPAMPPGVGGNCDNDQQNRICTVNNGHMYTDKRGCQVCQAPY
jgi:hypothetical protein